MQAQGLFDDSEEERDRACLGVANNGVDIAILGDAGGGQLGAQACDGDGGSNDEEEDGGTVMSELATSWKRLDATFGFTSINAVRNKGIEYAGPVTCFFAEAVEGLPASEAVGRSVSIDWLALNG